MVNKWAYVDVAFFLLDSCNKIPKFGTPCAEHPEYVWGSTVF